jgi:succinate dehydrogenase/fumarate reductase flavoprotein subunit
MDHAIDVLVCGSGCAGLGAAVAAARAGARVLLIERAPFAGA